MLGKRLKVGNSDFEIKAFLGKGKSGHSYLIENSGCQYVLKKMHDEPCSYYQFGDKLGSEIHAYYTLRNIGINMPLLIEYNWSEKYLVKEYVEGQIASCFIAQDVVTLNTFSQLFELARKARLNGLNLDYFPSNFIIAKKGLIYIDYELNQYSSEWNLSNWGIYYWLNSEGMKEYLRNNNLLALNIDLDSGVPIKAPFVNKAKELIEGFFKKY